MPDLSGGRPEDRRRRSGAAVHAPLPQGGKNIPCIDAFFTWTFSFLGHAKAAAHEDSPLSMSDVARCENVDGGAVWRRTPGLNGSRVSFFCLFFWWVAEGGP